MDVKVIHTEEYITQHKLIVADITVDGRSPKHRIHVTSQTSTKKKGMATPTIQLKIQLFIRIMRLFEMTDVQTLSQMISQSVSMMPGTKLKPVF